ncbi:hypothetical protein [Amycolatopsis sp. NBC_01480]|uniref:hypothetical protein n=1 Tax=Amycolatopsis sp. NBC_01480 TaxID=2903562 RepID=UPI002E2E3ACE|nr:hypothetical protein [Amycolatopsis sp. NBC_01480]
MSLTDPTLPASSVSDPSSPDYNPRSPLYDATADPSSKYYVGPIKPDDVLSGDQIRAEATEQVDQEIKDGWLGPVVDPKVRDQKIQELYQQHLDEAKQRLDEGLQIRQTGGAPHTVWANASHEQMQQAISQNADSATVAASSEEWVSVGNELAGHQQNLAQAINASTANWSGGGGDAAREHLANVGKWLGTTAQGATLSGRQQEIHSQTLNETQKAMAANPPVQFSVQDSNAKLQQITDPVAYAQQAQQAQTTYREQQAARGQAAQTMTRFDETIGSAVVTPQFPPPPKLAGSSGGGSASGQSGSPAGQPGSPNGGPGGTGPGANQPGFSTQSGQPGSPGGGSGQGGSNPGGNPSLNLPPGGDPGGGPNGGPGGSGPGGSGPGGSNPGGGGGNPSFSLPPGGGPGGDSGDGTHVQGFTPPPVNLPPGGGPGSGPGGVPNINIPGGGGSGPGGSGPGYTPPSFTPPGINPGSSLGPGGGSGPGATGGRIPTIGRGGGVNGESIGSRLGGGSGGSGASGSSGGLGGSGGKGSGVGGPGSGSGAAAEEGVAGRGAGGAGAGGKGAPGSPGMGGMGAGNKGGKGPEDKEHKIADFVESDDPSFFSPDEVVAPPVIGDWKNTDWK